MRFLCGMMVLMDIAVTALMAVLGLVMGSFAGAQVWRLRARQLANDKKAAEPYDKHEYKKLQPLMGRRQRHDRSQCLACDHELAAADLVPILSWAAHRGACRYCGAQIGAFEPIIELATSVLFTLSYLFWPFGFTSAVTIALFIVWLVAIELLVILAAYDSKWQLLPDILNYSFIAVSFAFAALRYAHSGSVTELVSTAGAIGMLAGVYGLIYAYSKGAWIGFGDVKLGVGLGLMLGDWRLAFLALFLANLIGCVIVLPGVLLKKLAGGSRIAFGPLLIAGTLIAFWWGLPFIEWLFTQPILL